MNSKIKKGLGRGLSSLIGETRVENKTNKLSLSDIVPNKFQPRKNFVEEDLSSLTGSETIINSYSSLLSGFNSTISSGNFASLSAIMTGPKDEDISKANDLLSMLNQAETLWDQTLTLIESQDADTKLSIYNSDDYKNAHAALLYLKNHVKPVIQKVSLIILKMFELKLF